MLFTKDLFLPIQEAVNRYRKTQAAIHYFIIAFGTLGGPSAYKDQKDQAYMTGLMKKKNDKLVTRKQQTQDIIQRNKVKFANSRELPSCS